MSTLPQPTASRRAIVARGGAVFLTSLLSGCIVEKGVKGAVGPATDPVAPPTSGDVIGSGPVKVALILPLTGPGQGATAARSLRNAAELSLGEFQGADLSIMVKDDRGTAEGARDAATQALADGAELIIGPLFAPSVAAAGQVARGAGKPMIAFSTDTTVATRGVYLLSFTPQPEVDRVLDYGAQQGRRAMAALIPESTYGNVVEAAFRENAPRYGIRVVQIERYTPGQPAAAVQRLAGIIAGDQPQVDAILIPESGEGLVAVGTALQAANFNPGRVKPLGTGVWNDPRTSQVAALAGGWYAAPDQAGYASFSGRYRAKFGSAPVRLATLSYDAVSLAAALARTQGAQRFSESSLQSNSGFAGIDGTFRFRPDGTNDRTLAVVEVRSGATSVVSPAPRTLGSGT